MNSHCEITHYILLDSRRMVARVIYLINELFTCHSVCKNPYFTYTYSNIQKAIHFTNWLTLFHKLEIASCLQVFYYFGKAITRVEYSIPWQMRTLWNEMSLKVIKKKENLTYLMYIFFIPFQGIIDIRKSVLICQGRYKMFDEMEEHS